VRRLVPVLVAVLAALVPPLYRWAVARQVRRMFDALNRGDWSAVNDALASEFSYRFHGDTSIGGLRRRRATMEAWWARMFRILPEPRFEVLDVVVAGPPWATRVATHATIRGTLPDGTPYDNVFMQRVVARFGRLVRVETIEDTQRLDRAMTALAAAGFPEATAPPLED
jgi:ketosteroid isomerase-like protein